MPSVLWDSPREGVGVSCSRLKSRDGETLFMKVETAIGPLPPTLPSLCAHAEGLRCPGVMERQRIGVGRKGVNFTAISTGSLLRGFCI